MSHPYQALSDDEKLELCIDYVARGAAMPEALRDFLIGQGLYELVTKPEGNTR